MGVTVEYLAKHSSGKDHVAMTGGTLSADKLVRGDGPLVLQHEFFPVVAVRVGGGSREALRRVYSGIHSIEHALASPAGGDLRARLDEVAGESGLGARLIDMSPYVPGLVGVNADGEVEGGGGAGGEWVIGFRSTVVSDGSAEGGLLPRDVIGTAYDRSLRDIRELFVGGGAVPFSTPEECGQYDLHSAEAAVELIDGAAEVGGDAEGVGGGVAGGAASAGGTVSASGVVSVGAREMYVCDLRLVKPRLAGAVEQRMLDVLGGHFISQVVERDAWRLMAGAREGSVAAGNFGCSTGEYLMVGNAGGGTREAVLREAHVAVARTLISVAGYEGDDALRRVAAEDARFAGEHIRRFGGGVWDVAVEAEVEGGDLVGRG